MPFRSLVAGTLLAVAVVVLAPRPAEAIPVFAHRYGLTCQACHTAIPHLTAFGETFLDNGYRIPGVKPKPAFPIALKVQTEYASTAEGGLPKAVVDEVELLAGGSIGSRGSYFAEAYVLDGGMPGHARDVWAGWRATPDGARTPLTVRAGQFTLPLPFDPETFRETTGHYAIWDQTAGDNPFTFFEPKIGGQLAIGDPARAIAGSISVLKGHDVGSGLPSHGLDLMLALQRTAGDVTLGAYRYDGTRLDNDRFWRTGYALGWERDRTRITAVYQTGGDSGAGPSGAPLRTSGGFVEVRHELSRRLFGIARWDATQDNAFSRSVIGGFGYRTSRNSRLTIFDTAKRDDARRITHELSTSFLFAL